MRFWSAQLLNVVSLGLEIPMWMKAVIWTAGVALTLFSLMNQVDTTIEKLPKWKAYWWTKWHHAKVHGNKLKRILKNKSGGKL